ncbi:recombinase family protein [Edwardsiella piscicida]|uniref:recombinase family protein n=1 Tax=Edwardsiella piscicida TaxID=1263550 RepID=UPI000D524D5B|nr:recombinase family protein [Edwardsiella piscicida]UCQ40065.1 recombinase family protein [Edwardsiella piscicida]
MAVKLPVFCYARVSSFTQTTEQGGYGLSRQHTTFDSFLQYCNEVIPQDLPRLDLERVTYLNDSGLSAYHALNWNKGQLGQLYQQIENGIISNAYLIVENIDRLSRRNPFDAIQKISFMIQHGLYIFEIETNQIFSHNRPESLLALQMSLNRSYSESKRKSVITIKNFKNRIDRYLQDGELFTKSSKSIPRWFDIDVKNKKLIQNDIATTIQKIFEMYADGFGNGTICKRLNDDGLLDVKRHWNTITLSRVLRDRRLIGEKRYGRICRAKEDEELIENFWPPVISRKLFDRVQAIIGNHKVSHIDKTTKKQKNLFHGLTRCGICGSNASITSNNRSMDYICCLSRRHHISDVCTTAQYMRWSPIERALVAFLDGIDWRQIYQPESNSKSVLDGLCAELRAVDQKISELKAELNKSDDDVVLALSRSIRKNQELQTELQRKIAAIEDKSGTKSVSFNFDEKLFDQNEVELRQNANVEYRKVIKEISITKLDDTYVFCTIKYFAEILHFVVIDLNTAKVESFATFDNGKAVMQFTDTEGGDMLRDITKFAINEYIKNNSK